MYLDWVLTIAVILLIVLLLYAIYRLHDVSEGFTLVQTPAQNYAIPELKGVMGRYVRIQPSLTGDGYLTISQIQVIDINGKNVALEKPVKATSQGGSEIDQLFGRVSIVGDTPIYVRGVSNGPLCITDGVLTPRQSLSNVFETSVQNSATSDTEYVEIDLGGEFLISSIIYTGRSDAKTTTFPTQTGQLISLTQVERQNGMRLTIRDGSMIQTYGPAMFTSTQPVQTLMITGLNFEVNPEYGSTGGLTKTTVDIPNVETFRAVSERFNRTMDLSEENKTFVKNTVKIITDAQPSFSGIQIDLSNNILPGTIIDYPISFFYDFYSRTCSSGAQIAANQVSAANGTSWQKTCNPSSGTGASTQPIQLIQVGNVALTVTIFGSASSAAISEMNESINLCRNLYLGSPAAVENYIRINYSTNLTQILPYLRGSTCPTGAPFSSTQAAAGFCVSEVIQKFQHGGFATLYSAENHNWNATHCTCALTPQRLSMIPFASRNFMIEWIRNRTIRYMKYTVQSAEATQVAAQAKYDRTQNSDPGNSNSSEPGDVQIYRDWENTLAEDLAALNAAKAANLAATTSWANPPTTIQLLPSINIHSKPLLDSIAQQFYELLGGQFTISYLYDVLPLGTTMFDIRFDLNIHTNDISSFKPINDLKAQYERISSAQTQTQDVLDQAAIDYESEVSDLEQAAISQTIEPFKGAVARIFYINSGPDMIPGAPITITGIIFDDKAVTSFITELNGGIQVPVSSQPGNINYQPVTIYTKNISETLDCTKPDTLKRIMADYVIMMNDKTNKYPLARATPPLDVKKGSLTVTEVIGSQQVSPSQCAITWKETLYDTQKNMPLTSGSGTSPIDITRNALISYKKDTSSWYSYNMDINIAGFKFYPTPSVPACVFNPSYYGSMNSNKFSSAATGSTLINDYLINVFKNGRGPVCPDAIPTYTFDPTVAGMSVQQFIQTGIYSNASLRPAQAITPFATPLVFTKSLPYKTNLDNLSNLCPTTSCEDLDVLYNLVDQYNSDPTQPGTILSVTHAFTPNAYQCDIKASINYDAFIDESIGTDTINPTTGLTTKKYRSVRKGTVTYSSVSNKIVEGSKAIPKGSSYTGIQNNITLALYVAIDKSSCTHELIDAGGQNSGTSIQSNTPALYTPMIYSTELAKRTEQQIGSSVTAIQTDYTKAIGSIKPTLKSYRINTYDALGKINTISVCSGKPCSDPSIQSLLTSYYASSVNSVNGAPSGITITRILSASSPDGKSCDATFTNSGQETRTGKFTFSSTGCAITGYYTNTTTPALIGYNANTPTQSNPIPTDDQILDITKELATTLGNYVVTPFTNYSPSYVVAPEAIDVRGFGLDTGRNSQFTMKETQFQVPLEQKLPEPKKRIAPKSYRFLRFTPTKTRDPDADAVHVGKFIFFYDEYPLFLKGTVTNPMGTWEGTLQDVVGPGTRPGWSDSHKKSLVFAFRDSIAVDAYSISTAETKHGIQGDPVSWKLEGSSNGTYWTLLDTQTNLDLPIERSAELNKLYLKL